MESTVLASKSSWMQRDEPLQCEGVLDVSDIATPMLWLHLLVINGDFKMTRVGGNDNCADLVSSRKSPLAHLHSSSLSQPFFS